MKKRQSLVDGVKSPRQADPEKEAKFVFGKPEGNAPPYHQPSPPNPEQLTKNEVGRLPITTRLRADLVKGLKRAALERELAGIEPNTVQEILEAALEPWLRQNGVLK